MEKTISKYTERCVLAEMIKADINEILKHATSNNKNLQLPCLNSINTIFLKEDKNASVFYKYFNGKKGSNGKNVNWLNELSNADLFIYLTYLNKILMVKKYLNDCDIEKKINLNFVNYCNTVRDDWMPYFSGVLDFKPYKVILKSEDETKLSMNPKNIKDTLYKNYLLQKQKIESLGYEQNKDINLLDSITGLNFGRYTSFFVETLYENKQQKLEQNKEQN